MKENKFKQVSNTFKVGDIVEVLPYKDEWSDIEPYWESGMDKMQSKQYKIERIDSGGDLHFQGYYFNPSWVKLTTSGEKGTMKKFWVVLHEDEMSDNFPSQIKAEAHARELSKESGSESYVLQLVSGYKAENKTTKIKIS